MTFALPHRNEPLSELNMTPLIDVLLVMLVVLILAVPLAAHSLDYDLPGESPRVDIMDLRNRITIGPDDRLRWNDTAVSERDLATILKRASAMRPEPQIEFAPDAAASYRASARVLELVKASGTTNFGFIGNEQHRNFGSGR